jgi:hypothetical protein
MWSAGTAAMRAGLHVASRVSLEAETGLLVPFVRYDLGSEVGSSRVYRTAAAGWSAALGVGWSL